MPGAFSEQERAQILARLKEKGKDLFGRLGVRKTNIEDITRATGIAKGSFYRFYDSKEEFFFSLLEEEEAAMRSGFDPARFFPSKKSAAAGLKNLLLYFFRFMSENPLSRLVFDPEEFNSLLRKLPQERVKAHMRHDEEYNRLMIRKLQEKGIIKKINPALVVEIFKAVVLSSLNRNFMDPDHYNKVVDFLCESLARSLAQKNSTEAS